MKNFDFVNDVDGYFFIYKNSNVSQYISRCIGISTLKLHNIIRKHNGIINPVVGEVAKALGKKQPRSTRFRFV